MLQQHLPLAVLKQIDEYIQLRHSRYVATALTACGIETINPLKRFLILLIKLQQHLPLAVLKL